MREIDFITKRKSLENGDNKDIVTEEIIKVTDKIKNIKKRIVLL